MKWIFLVCLVFLLPRNLIFGQKTKTEDTREKSEFTATIDSETGDTNLIIVYGKITEVGCLFNIPDVNISCRNRMYSGNNHPDAAKSDERGNYIIKISTYQPGCTLLFIQLGNGSHAEYLVPVPKEWKGKQVKLDIGLKLLFTGLSCY